MATIDADQRYAELLTHTDFDQWWIFVVGATDVIENHAGKSPQLTVNCVGLIEAQKRGEDLTQPHWRTLLWQLGAEADFYERLERSLQG